MIKLPGRLKSSRENEFENINTFSFFYLEAVIGEKEIIHINDRHVLPLKAFELNQKTQVRRRNDSFNSTHFHLARQIRGNHLFYGGWGGGGGGGWESQIESVNPQKTLA